MPLPPLDPIPPDIAAPGDYEPFAKERMTEEAWAYYSGGAADEVTLRRNRSAFDEILLQGRVLAGLDGNDASVSLLGRTLPFPILLAPVAYQKLVHPDGEKAAVLGAAAIGAGMIVSTFSSVPLEEIAQGTQGAAIPLWFQLYFQDSRETTLDLVRRAEAAGYEALVVTVDAPVAAFRNREHRASFRLPPGVDLANLRPYPAAPPPAGIADLLALAPKWADIAWLRSVTRLPILLKGVLSPDDAEKALGEGLDGLVVSNHGGRTLDTLPATIEALPRIALRVRGKAPILLDGGVRRGTDIVKALALGASAVLVGRPYIYGLAAAGPAGVAHVVNMLRNEFAAALPLVGRSRAADLSPEVLWHPVPGCH